MYIYTYIHTYTIIYAYKIIFFIVPREFLILYYGNTTHNTNFNIFPYMFIWNSNYITVTAGSAHDDSVGTIHNVNGGFCHGSYNYVTQYCNVAVLKDCTDFDIPIDSAKYVKCLQ